MTPTSFERAEEIRRAHPFNVSAAISSEISYAIRAAEWDERERGKAQTATVQTALNAALMDLARAKQQAHDNHVQAGQASAALNRVLLHVTGCSEGEFDTYAETADRILEQLRDNAQHLEETSDAFLQTTGELLSAQGDLAKVTKERDAARFALSVHKATFTAAHDRQVAAKVLRDIAPQINEYDGKALLYEAVLYERGEKEVPDEDA